MTSDCFVFCSRVRTDRICRVICEMCILVSITCVGTVLCFCDFIDFVVFGFFWSEDSRLSIFYNFFFISNYMSVSNN